MRFHSRMRFHVNSVFLSGVMTTNAKISHARNLKIATFFLEMEIGGDEDGKCQIPCKMFQGEGRRCVDFIEANCHQGSLILVMGRISEESWKAPDGTFKKRMIVIANDVQKLADAPPKEEESYPTYNSW